MQRKIPNINFRDKLHSIPISKMKNVKSNVLYSIPGGCVAALLSVGLVSLAPNLFNLTDSAYATDQTFGDSTASMTLDTSDVEVKVAPGEIGYASKNISLSISNVKDYTLTITALAALSKESTSGDTNTSSTATSWGYAYGQSGNVEDMTYTNFTGTAQTLESGNTDTISNKTLALAASFDDNNDAGHYKANITLALTATPKVAITYTLIYNGNGTNTSNIPTNQTCTAYDNGACTITLSSTKPTRSGYEFLGWASTNNATIAEYQPGTIIEISGDKIVYGVWKAKILFDGITTMQEMTNDICTAATVGDTAILTDVRDENKYQIRKHEDQRCWMTENLRITGKTINSFDSNLASGSFTITTTAITDFTSDNRLSSQSYLANNNGYYNHFTAVAGSNDITKHPSICPKGWRMPFTTGVKEAEILYGIVGSPQAMMKEPYNFSGTGYVSTNGSISSPSDGFWWMDGSAQLPPRYIT